MMRAISVSAFLLFGATAAAVELKPGTAFPLSDGAVPTLISVMVYRVTSDNTIDLAVSLNAPAPPPASSSDFMLQMAEICLRYQADIVIAAVPADERNRMNVFAPLYRVPVPGKSNEYQEAGFVFRIVDGACSLDPPFPATLRREAQTRANIRLGAN